MTNAPDVTSPGISSRAMRFLEHPNKIDDLVNSFSDNIYDVQHNPKGVVSMCIAENYLSTPLCCERMNMPDMNVVTNDMLHYFDYRGSIGLRRVMCAYLTKYFKPSQQLDPDQVYVTSGATAAMEMLASILADPGDYLLVFTPFYAAFITDFYSRANVKLIGVDIDNNMFYKPTTPEDINSAVAGLEEALAKAVQQGKTVKGVVLVNPHNPVGFIMPKEFIEAILQFSNKHGIHTIVDEVYALTLLDDHVTFDSVLSINIPNKETTHFVWSLSKDFGIAGVRCGVVYSWNKAIRSIAQQYINFSSVPPIIQYKIQVLLSDFEWLEKFFDTSLSLLRESSEYCMEQLERLNIPYIRPKAGYFVWANMSKLLRERTPAAELELCEAMLKAGVCFLPGGYQSCPDPGWFRITITHEKAYINQGFLNLEILKNCIISGKPE